jgi:colanic acid biosynthesis glycosyl transferase WcaI
VPLEEVTPYINACDVLLVPLRKLDILNTFVPSKLCDFLSCAKPVILMVDGEARQIIDTAGAGLCVEPENAHELATAIMRLRDQPAWLKEAGERGRAYVLQHYVRDDQARALEALLRSIVQSTT